MSGHNDHQCACGGSCGCNSQQDTSEVYLTREEYIQELEKYLLRLHEEVAAVQSELEKLRQVA